MVYYGLQLLSPNYFYVTACAISAIVAISIGSSWTVVGTIGIGFMGIAANMGLNPAIAAGAIISGGQGGANEKLAVMEECGIHITRNPAEMGRTMQKVLKG